MPLPKPIENESKKDFISRCMGDKVMNNEYSDNPMRYAICNTLWDKNKNQGADKK
jgi:hypothetical protein